MSIETYQVCANSAQRKRKTRFDGFALIAQRKSILNYAIITEILKTALI